MGEFSQQKRGYNTMINTFYYITGGILGKGLTYNGLFSLDRSQWKIFTSQDIQKIGNNKLISAAKKGKFINTKNY
jgi:hypothetical protein